MQVALVEDDDVIQAFAQSMSLMLVALMMSENACLYVPKTLFVLVT
jgi:hypothetical protein